MSAASGSPSHEAPEASTSTQERSTRSPAAKSDRLALSPVPSTRKPGAAQWTVDKSAPPSTSAGGEDIKRPPPIDDYSDQSSNDSDEDSDELDDGGDDHDRDRELSDGARAGVREDLTDKELVYVLEVIQQPQRARACGFGDKDRRPLSPPPIIQLRIFDKMGKAISPHSVNFHRFVLMVDLWNGDQSQQRSIVMHPGARQDQYALFTHTTSRPSSSHPYDQVPPVFGRPPGAPGVPPVGWPGPEWPMYAVRPQSHPSPSHSYPHGNAFVYGGPPPPHVSGWPPAGPEQGGRTGSLPPHLTSSPAPIGYPLPPEGYDEGRPGSSSARYSAEPQQMGGGRPSHSPHDSTRGWTPETPHVEYGVDRSFRPATSGAAEGGWRREAMLPGSGDSGRPQTASYSSDWDRMYPSGSAASSRPWSSAGETDRRQSSLYHQHPRPTPPPQPSIPLTASPVGTVASLFPESYHDRSTPTSHYSRVLVGSMGAVCQRLKGLNGEYGLFFFAHDLGIRTEGNFSLRFTLVDITTLSVGSAVKDDSAPILARIFSKSFTVYSAKRFPGVLPTTDLTQCFADQSVRLPTRQKRAHNGGNSSKRKK